MDVFVQRQTLCFVLLSVVTGARQRGIKGGVVLCLGLLLMYLGTEGAL